MDGKGYQVFVIHPEKPLRDELVHQLRDREYEAFGMAEFTLDHSAGSPDSIVILGANHLSPQSVAGLSKHRPGRIILAALGSSGFSGTFDHVITDETDIDGVLNVLTEIRARGPRSFVRFGGHAASIATFSFTAGGKHYAGMIHDISTAGFSCTFRPEPEPFPDPDIRHMQLNLPGHRLSLSGRFSGHRVLAGQSIHIFLFIDEIEPDIRECIRDFIYRSLELKLALQE